MMERSKDQSEGNIAADLHRLVTAAIEGNLSAGEAERLRKLLASSVAAQDAYLLYQSLHADMLLAGEDGVLVGGRAINQSSVPPASESPTFSGRSIAVAKQRSWLAGLLTGSLAAGLLGLLVGLPLYWSAQTANEQPVASVGTIVSLNEARWSKQSSVQLEKAGAEIRPGRVSLASGTVQFRMNCAAEVRLTGPAEIEIIDSKAVRLVSGNLSVTAPNEAIGFRVLTPTADVVDMGTEFGVSVDADGSTEVHVLKGTVVTRASGSEAVVPLVANEAGRVDANVGDLVSIKMDADRFSSGSEQSLPSEKPRENPLLDLPPLPASSRVLFLGGRTTERETHLLLMQQALAGLKSANTPRLFNAARMVDLLPTEAQWTTHVAFFRPTHVVLEFASSHLRWYPPDEFMDRLTKVVDRLQAAGIEPILETGHPLGSQHEERNAQLTDINPRIRQLAKARGLRLVDAELRFAEASSRGAVTIVPDGLAPTFDGHRVLAQELMAVLGYSRVPLPEKLELKLMPGVPTDWQFRYVPEDQPFTAAEVAELRVDDGWEVLTLPQVDPLAERMADPSQTIVIRDRARGFASHVPGPSKHRLQAVTYVDVAAPREAWLNTGAGLQAIWLNGERVFLFDGPWNSWHAGKDRIPVKLKAGRNEIVIEARANSFFLSVTDRGDWAIGE